MPEASPLHFNILSAVICSPRLTRCTSPLPLVPAPAALVTLPNPLHQILLHVAPTPLGPGAPLRARNLRQPVTHRLETHSGPPRLFYLLIGRFPLANHSASSESKEQTPKELKQTLISQIANALVVWIFSSFFLLRVSIIEASVALGELLPPSLGFQTNKPNCNAVGVVIHLPGETTSVSLSHPVPRPPVV